MSADVSHEPGRAQPTEARLNAWLDRARAKAGKASRHHGFLLERMRTQAAPKQARAVLEPAEAEATPDAAPARVYGATDQDRAAAIGDGVRKDADLSGVGEAAQAREDTREAQGDITRPVDQVGVEARPDGPVTQADVDAALAVRERQWRADATRAQEVVVQEARAAAETEAASRLASAEARWVDETAQAVEAAVVDTRSSATADAVEARDADVARERVKAEKAVSLAVASVRGEANEARAIAIKRVRTQVRHALLQSKRIIAQVRGEAARQRAAAEDELRRVSDVLTAKFETLRAEATTEREEAVREARVAAQTEAATALTVARGLWEDDANQALAAAVEKVQAEAEERLASHERQWNAHVGQEHDSVIREAPGTEGELDLRELDNDVHLEGGPSMVAVQTWGADDTPRQHLPVQAAGATSESGLAKEPARRDPPAPKEIPGSTTGDPAAPATPNVHEALDVPGSDAELERDLQPLDRDAQPRDAAATATIEAWQAEDAPAQGEAGHPATAATETEATGDGPGSPSEPEALPATGWRRFLRRSKSPRPSAKGR